MHNAVATLLVGGRPALGALPPPPPRSFPRAQWKQKTIILDDTGSYLNSPHGLADVVFGPTVNDVYKAYLVRNLEVTLFSNKK